MKSFFRCISILLAAALAALTLPNALAAPQAAGSAAALRAKYESLAEPLAHNQFMRKLYLESTQSSSALAGDVYAVVEHPFSRLDQALNGPRNWCDVMILHLNTKGCRATGSGSKTVLAVYIGKKSDQPLGDASRVDFAYRVAASAPDYLQVDLSADSGPLGTSQYRIVLEAVPLDSARSFLHLRYSYEVGMIGRLAMQTYLATTGRGKVGFTMTSAADSRAPEYIGGVRGVVERNTMRYYLAIDAYLAAMSSPAAEQPETRLRNWFDATERYPRQLHEVERADYLEMKKKEVLRQQAAP